LAVAERCSSCCLPLDCCCPEVCWSCSWLLLLALPEAAPDVQESPAAAPESDVCKYEQQGTRAVALSQQSGPIQQVYLTVAEAVSLQYCLQEMTATDNAPILPPPPSYPGSLTPTFPKTNSSTGF
jgi:hypothetical protein